MCIAVMLCLVLPLTGGCPKAFLSDCVCTCGPKPLCLILLLTHGQASSAKCLISSLRDGCSKDLSVQLYVHNKACLGLPLTNRCCTACLPRCTYAAMTLCLALPPHKRGLLIITPAHLLCRRPSSDFDCAAVIRQMLKDCSWVVLLIVCQTTQSLQLGYPAIRF